MIELIGDVTDEMKASATATFNLLNLSGNAFVEVEYLDELEMQELNARTRGIDKPTDVLSYPMLDEITAFSKENYPYDFDKSINGVFLGSIVICKKIASEQAIEYGHSEKREYTYLLTHGLLHLLGYDHMEEDDKRIMREKEEEILSSIGVNR
ncbi:MAG: rRNA maturation RNase YbeY [Clostridia bacterium]|nr:rRNA maturation RNase YbeY [Clostridia bacterium]